MKKRKIRMQQAHARSVLRNLTDAMMREIAKRYVEVRLTLPDMSELQDLLRKINLNSGGIVISPSGEIPGILSHGCTHAIQKGAQVYCDGRNVGHTTVNATFTINPEPNA